MSLANLPPGCREHETDGKRELATATNPDRQSERLLDLFERDILPNLWTEITYALNYAQHAGGMSYALAAKWEKAKEKSTEKAQEPPPEPEPQDPERWDGMS